MRDCGSVRLFPHTHNVSAMMRGGVLVLPLWCLSDGVGPPQEEVLEQQQAERDDSSFHHVCMFCSEEFTGNR